MPAISRAQWPLPLLVCLQIGDASCKFASKQITDLTLGALRVLFLQHERVTCYGGIGDRALGDLLGIVPPVSRKIAVLETVAFRFGIVVTVVEMELLKYCLIRYIADSKILG